MSDTAENLFAKAAQLHQAGQFLEARSLYERVLKKMPKHMNALNLLGVTYMQTNEYQKAVPFLKQAVAIRPNFADTHYNLGLALQESGRTDLAMACYQKAVPIKPSFIEAQYSLASVFKSMKRFEDAVACFRKALSVKPDFVEAHDSLGNTFKNMGETGKAIDCYRKAISINPKFAGAHYNLGNTFRDMGRNEEAALCYREALRLNPHDAEAYNNLGLVLKSLKQLREATDSFQQAISIRPDYIYAHNNLGNVLYDLKRFEEAKKCYQQALAISPDYINAHNNLGNTLQQLGQTAEAIACHRKTLSINPDFAEAHNNLGNALKDLQRIQESLACYEKALSINPDYTEAQWNRSLAFLTLGQFQQGWQNYEIRWQDKERKALPETPYPLWLGELPLTDKNLLIQFEQGFGDVIQMLRYVAVLKGQGIECWIQVPLSMRGLIIRSFPEVRVTDEPSPAGADYRVPVMSLPLAMQTFSEEAIPKNVPYLVADPVRSDFWKEQLTSPSFTRRAGLVWRGNPEHKNDHNRSARLEDVLPLIAAHPTIQFVTLQKDLTEAECAALGEYSNVRILDAELTDFDETAAVMSVLDLVISIDSAPAHLAGALSRPVWILLPYAAEWRWLMDRSDSPWYPTAILFRQKSIGDWAGLVGEMSMLLGDQSK